jgi:hypothetical protein
MAEDDPALKDHNGSNRNNSVLNPVARRAGEPGVQSVSPNRATQGAACAAQIFLRFPKLSCVEPKDGKPKSPYRYHLEAVPGATRMPQR